MATPQELMLQGLNSKYKDLDINEEFTRLYTEHGTFDRMFASFHQRLNEHFSFMNRKARSNRHFNAQDSRQLLDLIEEIHDAQKLLTAVGNNFTIAEGYRRVIALCEQFLVLSGGSSIPQDFPKIEINRYEPAFVFPDTHIRLTERRGNYELKMIGAGAFANVYRFDDPDYGPFALKRAKRNIEPKELQRFQREFELLKKLRFPNILQVYRYYSDRNEYTMEYCDSTLDDYIAKHNTKLSFGTRKRIALQLLHGLNYIHSKSYLHRDISNRNVLVKQYDGAAVMVKLSDFGLYKERGSEFTSEGSEMRGTIKDPTIRSFKDYNVLNEIYSIGVVLSYIFSGRQGITACTGPVRPIINKCVSHDQGARYPDVISIIHDVEALKLDASDSTTETLG